MTLFKKAFTTIKTIIKQTNLKKSVNNTDKIDIIISRFVYNPCYHTQLYVYEACRSYPLYQSKIILNYELYDFFEKTINAYSKKSTQTQILMNSGIIFPVSIFASTLPQPFDLFITLWTGGFVSTMSFVVNYDIDVRQKFLYEFLNDRIERGENVLSNLTKT
jgi:hypothetical protein